MDAGSTHKVEATSTWKLSQKKRSWRRQQEIPLHPQDGYPREGVSSHDSKSPMTCVHGHSGTALRGTLLRCSSAKL